MQLKNIISWFHINTISYNFAIQIALPMDSKPYTVLIPVDKVLNSGAVYEVSLSNYCLICKDVLSGVFSLCLSDTFTKRLISLFYTV